ncbi:MAG: asparagine synthase (glutamine-hydrolyzing) [Candidatus Pacebacteria bacterium]|nr:asparagine synthase (glutamine-hydrolyzing) [Candidatus Paceibacterota bacterium]MCF7856939.1 asparagine synthase (glutamine-hydrolyzing) [Candidatus Paceibacterota bacterium]
MCAINGVTKNDEARVVLMNKKTNHRGPDGSSVFVDSKITLGHNRLAIIDVSDASAQPMKSNDGRYVIVYNGELYNFKELREELVSRYEFKTQGDTEVLLAAYIVWGEEMFTKLRGIFALAIWDTKTEELLLARDHMGVKPLYYHFENGILSFSSEINGLIDTQTKELDQDALALYMEFGYVPSSASLTKNIKKLSPGHCILYKNERFDEHAFYDPICNIGIPALSANPNMDPQQSLVCIIDTAVQRQLVSDRPVGMFLSGGIDSSVVLHHASKYTPHMRTFSVDFEMVTGAESEGGKFNTDAALAAKTAQIYGAQHKTFTLTIEDVRNNLVLAIESLDEPVANPTAISQYLLSKWVRDEGVVVALGGDGGDELFGGYTRHRMSMAAYYFQKIPALFRAPISHLNSRVGKLNTELGFPMHMMLMANKVVQNKDIFLQDFSPYIKAEAFFTSAYARVPQDTYHPVDTFMRIDRETWLPDESLARSDRSSMAHGLELRVPLLDLDVVTYADTISVYKKTDPFTGKKILRNAYSTHLPEYLYNQPKRGWISPGAKWFRDPVIMSLAKEILSPTYYDGLNLFNWPVVETMLLDHIEKRGYYLYPLWNILVLQIWARKNRISMQ